MADGDGAAAVGAMRDALAMLRDGRTVDAPQLAPAVAAALARVVSGGCAQLRREKRHGEAAEALREAVAAAALPARVARRGVGAKTEGGAR